MVLIKSACTTGTGTSRSTKYQKLDFWGWPKYFPVPEFVAGGGGLAGQKEKREREIEREMYVCVFLERESEWMK